MICAANLKFCLFFMSFTEVPNMFVSCAAPNVSKHTKKPFFEIKTVFIFKYFTKLMSKVIEDQKSRLM